MKNSEELESTLRELDNGDQRLMLFIFMVGISSLASVILGLAVLYALPNYIVELVPYMTRFEVIKRPFKLVAWGTTWTVLVHTFTLVMYVKFHNVINGKIDSFK